VADDSGGLSTWYWIDSTLEGDVKEIFGPFQTTTIIPGPSFFAERNPRWGNAYPLMCNEKNPKGIECDHWVMKPPSVPTHGVWCAFRKDSGAIFRIFSMDVTNPLMVPILGSYYITNIPSFQPGDVSEPTVELIRRIKTGEMTARTDYWNPMVTQQDIHRALAFPLAYANCTAQHIQAVVPGFTAKPVGTLPRWTDKTYIEGWTIGMDFIPYFTRVCYLWTGESDSRQQSIFIGQGLTPGQGSYLNRRDTCLNLTGTVQPVYDWNSKDQTWLLKKCLERNPPVGLPRPGWLADGGGFIVARIEGNKDFGLAEGQAIDLIAAPFLRGPGELAIFWLWFFETGAGMLFSEGNYLNPLSHNLQLIDYVLFERNAKVSHDDFSNPCVAVDQRISRLQRFPYTA
jgi:hypothetical protein